MNRWFDSFAETVAQAVARAGFFAFCVLLVLVWVPSLPLFGTIDTWQLVINTVTTIVTFLLVALLQNTQDRSTRALNHKQDAIIEALVVLVDNVPGIDAEDCVKRLREMQGTELLAQGDDS